MINLFNYFLEANVILLGFALVYYSLIAKQSHFQFRRWYVLMAVVSSVLIPSLNLNLSSVAIVQDIFPTEIATITLPEVIIGGEQEKRAFALFDVHWSFFLYSTYCLVVFIFLVRFVHQLIP